MSEALDTAHDLAKALHAVGAMDAITLRAVELLCLPKAPAFSATEVKGIRSQTRMSQSVFAALLNVTSNTVAQWEQGKKKPSGPSARLLDLVRRKGIGVLV